MSAIEDNTIIQWLPTHWVTAIINDDYSGLSDQEYEEIQAYLEDLNGWIYCPDNEACEDTQFRIPDCGNSAAECIQVHVTLN